jgi:hypothetical protein
MKIVSDEATALASRARVIHQLQRHLDVDELRVRFDDLAVIVERLAVLVAHLASSKPVKWPRCDWRVDRCINCNHDNCTNCFECLNKAEDR